MMEVLTHPSSKDPDPHQDPGVSYRSTPSTVKSPQCLGFGGLSRTPEAKGGRPAAQSAMRSSSTSIRTFILPPSAMATVSQPDVKTNNRLRLRRRWSPRQQHTSVTPRAAA